MENKSYDVFISYRRDGGSGMARLLYDRLSKVGYKVAYDHESLVSGRFDGQILRAISSCKDVVVILSPGALPRTIAANNMFRQEIAYALRTERNVIPLMMDKFNFPKDHSDLPEDIRALAVQNGIGADMEYFNSAFKKLCTRLKSKPAFWTFRRIFKWLLLLAFSISIVGVYTWNISGARPYPISLEEKRQFGQFIGDLTLRGMAYNELMLAKRDLLRDCQSGDVAAYRSSVAQFLQRARLARNNFDKCLPVAELSRCTEGSTVNTTHLMLFVADLRDHFNNLEIWTDIISPDSSLTRNDKAKIVAAYKSLVSVDCDLFACNIMSLLANISESAVKDFKESSQLWSSFPRLSEPWIHNDGDLQRKSAALLQRNAEIANDIATVTGNLNTSLTRDYNLLEQWFVAGGFSPEHAESLVNKMRKADGTRILLKETQTEIEERKRKLREEKMPRPSDTPLELRNKMLVFMKCKMFDEALKCLALIKGKPSLPDFPDAAIKTVERFLTLCGNAPFSGGVLVVDIERPASSHAICKIGDVVTAIDGEHCCSFDEYAEKSAPGKTYTIYRLNEADDFVKYDLVMPEGQPRLGLIGFGS